MTRPPGASAGIDGEERCLLDAGGMVASTVPERQGADGEPG